MRKHYRWTIKDLKEMDNWQIIIALINERQSFCTNVYTPLYERLTELEKWAQKQVAK